MLPMTLVELPSTIDEWESPKKSIDTSGSSVYAYTVSVKSGQN
jgi:hypothetical protein